MSRAFLLFSILHLAIFTACSGEAPKADAKHEFAEFQCAYTLPGPDWSWGDVSQLPPGAIF